MEPITVLIIDPDEANRNFLSQMVTKKGYTVIHASLGREGARIAGTDLPSLIVFEPSLPDLTLRDFLAELSQNPRTANIPCVALSSHSNMEEMQVCLQAGCVEYYVKSGMVMLNMVDAIPKLVLSGKSVGAKNKNQEGLLIVFLSAKGGTGTSSLCANIGMSIAHHIQSASVAMVDLVLPMGSLAPIVGNEDDAINLIIASQKEESALTPEYFDKELYLEPDWGFTLLSGSTDPAMAAELDVAKIPTIISTLRKKHDYLFVDIGRSLSRITVPIIEAADLVVLVLSTDLSTADLTKKLWAYLRDLGVSQNKVFAILNRAVGLEGLSKSDAENMLGLKINLMMPYLMGNFTLANNQHLPLIRKFPTDTASMVLKDAALAMSRQAIAAREQDD